MSASLSRVRAAGAARIMLSISAAAVAALGAITTVSAHAVQPFGGYTVAIGWINEPTYIGVPNGVQVFVWQGTGDGYVSHPVSDLNGDQTKPDLQVTVSFGSTTSKALFLAPAFDSDTGRGNPAEYDAPLTPTQVGAYTFHLTGSIHGTAVDKSFTSADNTFNAAEDQSSVDFPNPQPAIGAVSTKVDQVSNRVTSVLGDAQRAASSANDAANTGNRATVLAIIALIVAVVLGGANLAMSMRRRA